MVVHQGTFPPFRQSTKKISGTSLAITFGNFTNDHSTAPRLLSGVPFFSLVCGVHTFF
jgi:hypothetical protein